MPLLEATSSCGPRPATSPTRSADAASEGRIFCLVEAPDAETAAQVHREAHGLLADEIHQAQEGC